MPVRPVHVMARTIGPRCNLDCTYCRYLSRGELPGKPEHWATDQASATNRLTLSLSCTGASRAITRGFGIELNSLAVASV